MISIAIIQLMVHVTYIRELQVEIRIDTARALVLNSLWQMSVIISADLFIRASR